MAKQATGNELTTPSKTLSKEALYAPISSYINPTTKESTALARLRKLKDHSVCDFLEQVSRFYTGTSAGQNETTQSNAQINDPARRVNWDPTKVTSFSSGSIAIKRNVIDGKILQRSLVLVGGGVNFSGGGSIFSGNRSRGLNEKKTRMVGGMSNRKRRRKNAHLYELEEAEDISPVHESVTTQTPPVDASEGFCTTNNSSSTKTNKAGKLEAPTPPNMANMMTTLESLNELWGTYAKDLLRSCCVINNSSALDNVKIDNGKKPFIMNAAQIHQCQQFLSSQNIELCGALIRVIKCASHPKFINLEGMVVQETANTWRILSFQSREGKLTRNKKRRKLKKMKAQQCLRKREECFAESTIGDEVPETKMSKSDQNIPVQKHNSSPLQPHGLNLIIVPKKKSALALRMSEQIVIMIGSE